MNKYKNAFTLAEVLLAMAIVGVLAVLTIPALVNKVSNKLFANQAKNMSAMVEELAQDELITKKTRYVDNTDFSSPATLLTNSHFSISNTCGAESGCWNNNYKTINKGSKNITAGTTVILTNGVMLSYSNTSGSRTFTIDVNGKDKPNIIGRDVFVFKISDKGNLETASSASKSLTQLVSSCKGGSGEDCFNALRNNGWKTPY